ncbi:hypothetical protein [Bacillus glycinifermentans]|uniref:hypothetical protein n=1 Tax=Bacillus glycinifermentans TaxID=1664069 RepID=UPI001E6197CC|nr:hypothetical protein [Bacillus glycinifermentans]MEC0496826.1 hypothetical protein [Bacillus glycinifermentans]MEC0539670.1 hypothetical protein [Bacillus glycinifermentans]
MNEDVVTFKCPTCKQVPEKPKMESSRFEMVAFEEGIEWSDFTGNVPSLDERIWTRSDQAPVAGEERIIQVSHPFHLAIGETFWTLFMPARSSLNGWDSYPSEIGRSAFVQFGLEQVIDRNEEKAWVKINIHHAVYLKDISSILPVRDGSGALNFFHLFDPVSTYGDWILLDANAQSNLGVWALIHKTAERSHLAIWRHMASGNLIPIWSMAEI